MNLSKNAETILKKRYLNKGESIEGMFRRVANGNDKYYELMVNLKFLPNSPTLFNLGLNNGCTLSACFVFDVDDSMLEGSRSIVRTREKAIAVAKAGGGVGYYFGNIRPKGSLIKSVHRKACGPVAVLRDYHGVRQLITQGGKRDLAQMGVLPSWHDDIFEFIHCKDEDPKSLESFNISVSWTDENFRKSFDDKTKENNIWKQQVKSAWSHGCPGILFYDTVNKYNVTPHLGNINATNPCVTGDTLLLTKFGWKRIDKLVSDQKIIPVWNGMEWSDVKPIMTGRNQRILKISMSSGHYIKCTPYHTFYLADGSAIKANELKIGDCLEKFDLDTIDGAPIYQNSDTAYLSGFFSGDGYILTKDNSKWISFYHDKKIEIGRRLLSLGYLRSKGFQHKLNRETMKVLADIPDKNFVPLGGTIQEKISWLAGLLDSDGCAVYSSDSKESYGYQIYSINKGFLRKVSLLLMELGIHSKVTLGKKKQRKAMPGGIYDCKTSYRVLISTNGAVRLSELGMKTFRVICDDNTPNRSALRFVRVLKVVELDREDVYCVKEPKLGKVVFNGILTGNCGETPNLCDEPCDLGSINLSKYVHRKTIQFMLDELARDVRTATEFLDDILDWNVFPHPDITKAALATRKIGLGVMGWADTLALMGIHYDSEKAIEFAKLIMITISEVAKSTSVEICKTKGPYEAYKSGKCLGNETRNSTVTSIAPTGTISLIAGCSSGIEPHYSLEWQRTTNEGIKMDESISVLNELNGFVPKIANEIDWAWHVRHQAAFQKFTDLGVSKTVNLPNNTTEETISDVYREMWRLECKGGTVFRDGCRSEQVLVSKNATSVYSLGVELPKNKTLLSERKSTTHKFKINNTTGFLNVGLFEDGSPGEIFLRFSKVGSSISGMVDTWAISFSVALQNGTKLEELCKHHIGTKFEPCGLTDNKDIPICSSVPDYVSRWLLKKFSNQTINFRSGEMCPDCGQELVNQGNCLTCINKDCGYSKCG